MSSTAIFETATNATEHKFREMLRHNPVGGEIQVSLEREPNAFHAAGISGDRYQLILAIDPDTGAALVAAGRFELSLYVNGSSRTIGYLGELRASGGFRFRRRLLYGLRDALRAHHEAGSVPFYLTTVIADNLPARRLLEARLEGLPIYEPLESLVTFTIPTRAGARRHGTGNAELATKDVTKEIVAMLARQGIRYQFQPVWTEVTLRSAERCRGLTASDFLISRDVNGVNGCLALWDQRSFKQTVIRGYSRRLAMLRPFLNVLAPFVSRPGLPPAGSRLESAFLSHVAVEPDDADTLVTLVARGCAMAAQRGIDYVMIAFSERHPFTAVIRRSFPCREYVSIIYAVYLDDDAAASADLDGRIAYPEVAIL